jgi:hypothetical protein
LTFGDTGHAVKSTVSTSSIYWSFDANQSTVRCRLGANWLTPDKVDSGLASCAINFMSDAGQELRC